MEENYIRKTVFDNKKYNIIYFGQTSRCSVCQGVMCKVHSSECKRAAIVITLHTDL